MTPANLKFHDYHPALGNVADDVRRGLLSMPKRLPCYLLYDDAGSKLFEKICGTKEYYVTRAELSILEAHARDMAKWMGPSALVVEHGAGNTQKVRLLLKELKGDVTYVAVDISRDFLLRAAHELAVAVPQVRVEAICSDFKAPLDLSKLTHNGGRRVLFFPGSTIGNLEPDEAKDFLAQARHDLGARGGVLIGVDLKKDTNRLTAAYNDAEGITAQFEKNVLTRINRELDGKFDLNHFDYRAVYNQDLGRIEMSLVSRVDQVVPVAKTTVSLRKGERIINEHSYKYSTSEFAALAARAGWNLSRTWTDSESLFTVHALDARP